jgi:hypothetical protein
MSYHNITMFTGLAKFPAQLRSEELHPNKENENLFFTLFIGLFFQISLLLVHAIEGTYFIATWVNFCRCVHIMGVVDIRK